MSVLEIEYICQSCGKPSPEENKSMVCKCGGLLKGHGVPGITGTRDSFGIKNCFRDESNGKVIDNWNDWEKAGFRNPVDTTKDHDVKEKIKRKINKIKHDKK